MASATLERSGGLREAIERLAGQGPLDLRERHQALALYESLPSGRERTGSYWKIDLDSVDLSAVGDGDLRPATARFFDLPEIAGIVACDLSSAARDHAPLLARAYGKAAANSKFVALTRAFATGGAFLYIPTGVQVERPIVISYDLESRAAFPHTVVVAEDGAACTIVERISSTSVDALVGSVTEIATGDRSAVTHTTLQRLPDDARTFWTRSALPGRDARFAWHDAQLGAALSVGTLHIGIDRPGTQAEIVSLFFPSGDQHVDLISTVAHRVGEASSETIVRSAANGSGQGRYVGNITISPHAHGTQASLKDDALLLSANAHIDSVPALEIAANDVKAFHGATVGAIDESALFYMMSRGIERSSAEKLIALGFFEPAISRLDGSVHAELRDRLAAKIEHRT